MGFLSRIQVIYNPNPHIKLEEDEPPRIEVYHYHNDHLGTPNELTNNKGEVVWLADYEAWGNTAKIVYKPIDLHIEQVSDNILQPIRFQGQFIDEETGLHYNRFRYFDNDVGMFISRDPIGLLGGINTFAYAPNPTGWIDPLGLSKKKGNKDCCRKLWDVKRYDEICVGRLNGAQVTYLRDPTTKLWWSKDNVGHGGSAWKVMKKQGNNLIHQFDADIYGDYMLGKHKGDTGKVMDMKKMKCKKVKTK